MNDWAWETRRIDWRHVDVFDAYEGTSFKKAHPPNLFWAREDSAVNDANPKFKMQNAGQRIWQRNINELRPVNWVPRPLVRVASLVRTSNSREVKLINFIVATHYHLLHARELLQTNLISCSMQTSVFSLVGDTSRACIMVWWTAADYSVQLQQAKYLRNFSSSIPFMSLSCINWKHFASFVRSLASAPFLCWHKLN
jgi:hypothetical protein